jgi:hypothetical protein
VKDGPGILAQQGAGNDRGGIDQPESKDRFQGEAPVGEASFLGEFITHGSYLWTAARRLQSAPCRLAEAQPPPVEQSTVFSRERRPAGFVTLDKESME